MTVNILLKEQIRYEILKIFSGYCFRQRQPRNPKIYILSPWISDVLLEIDPEFIYELDWKGFPQEYRISSINLPYALLLLILDFGAEINIVTLPPDANNYRKDRIPLILNLLDFLDEIGCGILLNPNLHSKLALANDLALVGSVNLSESGLYYKEEIGVSIDDLKNLEILEGYAFEVVRSSKPYGYTFQAEHAPFQKPGPIEKATRGWLYRRIVVEYFGPFYHQRPSPFDEFVRNYDDFKQILNLSLYDVAKKVSSDLESFYSKAVEQFLSAPQANKEDMSSFFGNTLGYWGELEIGKVLNFLKTKFIRECIPKVRLRIKEYSYE